MAPMKLSRPCAYPLCPNLALPNQRYCSVHAHLQLESTQRYDREVRDQEQRRFYGSVYWKKLRAWYLSTHPLCECDRCRQLGLSKAAGNVAGPVCPGGLYEANDVHHVDGDWRNNETENFMAIRHDCHSRITAARQGGMGNPRKQ